MNYINFIIIIKYEYMYNDLCWNKLQEFICDNL